MRRLPDASSADWLLAGLVPHGEHGPPYLISTSAQLIPPIYDAYGMMFHRIDAEIRPAHEGQSWASWEHSQPEVAGAPPLLALLHEASTLVRGVGAPAGDVRRVLWRDLTASLGLEFSPRLTDRVLTKAFGGSWPRHYFGPDEGRLDTTQVAALAETLSRHSAAREACFRYWWLATDDWDGGQDQVFQGDLLEIPKLHEAPFFMRCTPTHWFPQGRQWCVASDYDCTMTLVGGSAELIAALLAHPMLEMLQIGREEPLDTRGANG